MLRILISVLALFKISLASQPLFWISSYQLTFFVTESELVLARNLVTKMVNPSPAERPTTVTILKHPYFWSPDEQLRFLEVSHSAGETVIS